MKDIVLKKLDTPQHEPSPHTKSKPSGNRNQYSQKAERFIEDYSQRFSTWISALYARFSPDPEFTVVAPSTASSPTDHKELVATKAEPTHHAKAKGERRAKVLNHIKHHSRKLHDSAKTPIGKLAIVQAAAIAALFVYVQHDRPAQVTTAQADTATSTQVIQQKYLPSVGQYTDPVAFVEPDSKSQNPSLPYHSWVTPWNIDSATATQSLHASYSAFWLTLDSDGIHATPKADWQLWQSFKQTVTATKPVYYLTISGDPNYSYLALSDQSIQSQQIAELLRIVEEQGFDGIDIDYEALPSEDRNQFSEYIANLTSAFHDHNKLVAVTLEARINNAVPMDWHMVGSIADQVRIMVYDYHSQNTGEPGSVAPIGWLKDVLDYAQSTISGDKLVVGLGNYGYDWTKVETEDGKVSWQGVGISFDQATALAQQYSAPIVRATGIDSRGYDTGSVPTFSYKDESGAEHSVWFEDKQSLQDKVNLVSQYKTKGVIFWSVGLGDSGFWQNSNTGQ